jgi:hypothetical protein
MSFACVKLYVFLEPQTNPKVPHNLEKIPTRDTQNWSMSLKRSDRSLTDVQLSGSVLGCQPLDPWSKMWLILC